MATSFEYQLHQVGPVLAGLVLYPFNKAKEALTLYRDFATSIPDEVNTIGGLLTSLEGEPVAAIAACYSAMSPRHACLCRPRRLPRPAHPREKPDCAEW